MSNTAQTKRGHDEHGIDAHVRRHLHNPQKKLYFEKFLNPVAECIVNGYTTNDV